MGQLEFKQKSAVLLAQVARVKKRTEEQKLNTEKYLIYQTEGWKRETEDKEQLRQKTNSKIVELNST